MNKNTVILTVISIVAIFAFLTGAYMLTNKPPVPENVPEIAELKKTEADDNIKWSPAKKHIVVEYSDLQCPACRNFHTYMKQNVDTDKQITDNVTFVYRHFPLTQIHKNAYKASLAAEAAGNQKKFFEYADMLFTNQTDWESSNKPEDKFAEYAQKLKLNVDTFKKDMTSKEVEERVNNDVRTAQKYQVDSTPTFFLDGKRLTNINTYDDLKELLRTVAVAN